MKFCSKIDLAVASIPKILFRLAIVGALLAVTSVFADRAFAQQQADPVRATLLQFGQFASHPKYGEVWTPTVTPPGWHPYAPCNWVNSKVGWYYDDKTPWGRDRPSLWPLDA